MWLDKDFGGPITTCGTSFSVHLVLMLDFLFIVHIYVVLFINQGTVYQVGLTLIKS